jgi:hypothetical protein
MSSTTTTSYFSNMGSRTFSSSSFHSDFSVRGNSFGVKYLKESGSHARRRFVCPHFDNHFDNLFACGRSSPVTFGTGVSAPYFKQLQFGQALLMIRIDIHMLPSQVVYLVSHESNGPGGVAKQGITYRKVVTNLRVLSLKRAKSRFSFVRNRDCPQVSKFS